MGWGGRGGVAALHHKCARRDSLSAILVATFGFSDWAMRSSLEFFRLFLVWVCSSRLTIAALIIRIGFGGMLYYNNQEPHNPITGFVRASGPGCRRSE